MKLFTTLYILLLAYIVAALLFWGFSLYRQNERIFQQELIHLRSQIDSTQQPQLFNTAKQAYLDKRMRRKQQFTGEGGTFLIVIFIGASIVYSSYRRGIRLSQQQNNFMLSVTHELKSPIAAIKLNLQTLEKHQLDKDKTQQLIGKSIVESNRLNDLCNNILMTSQLEGNQHQAVFEKIDFDEFLTYILAPYQQRYPQRIVVNLHAATASIQADKLMLQLAINNLVENALKYSTDEVVLHSFTKSQRLYFRVSDYGNGISDSEKQKVFMKFYRMGNENVRTTKGTGLGLYLTDKIIKQHKGSLTVKDNKPKGAVFEMKLPLA